MDDIGSMKIDDWKHASRSNGAKYHIYCKDEILVLHAAQPSDLHDMGAVKQLASPTLCRGNRIRFQAEVATKDTDGAGLWLTASHRDWHLTDGMYDRLIKGTSDWQPIALVIDVPADTTYISFGVWMTGNGECRIRNPKFDLVDEAVPVTASKVWDQVASSRWVERPDFET